jgi:hypothetical protein
MSFIALIALLFSVTSAFSLKQVVPEHVSVHCRAVQVNFQQWNTSQDFVLQQLHSEFLQSAAFCQTEFRLWFWQTLDEPVVVDQLLDLRLRVESRIGAKKLHQQLEWQRKQQRLAQEHFEEMCQIFVNWIWVMVVLEIVLILVSCLLFVAVRLLAIILNMCLRMMKFVVVCFLVSVYQMMNPEPRRKVDSKFEKKSSHEVAENPSLNHSEINVQEEEDSESPFERFDQLGEGASAVCFKAKRHADGADLSVKCFMEDWNPEGNAYLRGLVSSLYLSEKFADLF